jgi:sulfite exporter TauE/SafE
VAGVVLAVFVGSMVATVVPAFSAAQSKLGGATSLAKVLRDPYDVGPVLGLAPQQGVQLMAELGAYPGLTLVPIYANSAFSPGPSGPPPPPSSVPDNAGQQNGFTSYDSVISCASLAEVPALGHCPSGAQAVYANLGNMLLTDNPLSVAQALPAVTRSSPGSKLALQDLRLSTLLLKAKDSADLERARTFLTLYNRSLPTTAGMGTGVGLLTAWQMGDLEPETFGELAQVRNNDLDNIENVVLAIVALTLLVAACSLAVTVGGGIVERKRPFTLLRVSGTSSGTLRRVVLTESLLPLVTASVLAAVVGIGAGANLARALPVVEKQAGSAFPGGAYYLALGVGLAVAVLVVSSALPLLGRLTRTENARFE